MRLIIVLRTVRITRRVAVYATNDACVCTTATLVKPFLCLAVNLRPVIRSYRFQLIVWHLLVQVIALNLRWFVKILPLFADEHAHLRKGARTHGTSAS